MARATVQRRLTWQAASIAEIRTETDTARTIALDVPGWPGHLAGQHVDNRLTAENGYSAQRSYSVASAPDSDCLEVTVQRVPDGEVSGYLVDIAQLGDMVEVRGPVGGYFTWEPEDPQPVLLVAGGSGVVPLMSMIRARSDAHSRVPFRLIYSTRAPADAIYADELRRRVRDDQGLDVHYRYSRTDGRITVATLNTHGWPADFAPTCFVCGPTGFVETVSNALVALGHDPRRISLRTARS